MNGKEECVAYTREAEDFVKDAETPIGAAPPPQSEGELLTRARSLAGHPLSAIAKRHAMPVPASFRRAKGWTGTLIERALGATATSRAMPDFPHLGIELKTIPVDERGRPRQSTYVCTAPLSSADLGAWDDSWVRRKLSRVLWVPIVGDGEPGSRIVGTAFPWTPTPEEAAQLEADWAEFSTLVALGDLSRIDARLGKALQVRPKAADASARTWALDEGAHWVRDLPRGFYLRPSFTGALLARELLLPK
ncbi:MAG: DNA mismatch repair endonuclease MutH [Planctomycetota bacterium]